MTREQTAPHAGDAVVEEAKALFRAHFATGKKAPFVLDEGHAAFETLR